jgi:hypothetical protein
VKPHEKAGGVLMDDETKASLAAAIAGGYILGRTKKGRLALTSVAFLLGRRFNADPKQLVAEGVQRLREVPQVSELEQQVKTEGLDVARKALSSVVGRGLKSATGGLSSHLPGADVAKKGHEDGHGEEAEEAEEADEAEDSGERTPPKRSRPPTKKRSPGRAADRAAPAKKTAQTAKKTSKRTAPAKRTASSPAKKAASSKARPHGRG